MLLRAAVIALSLLIGGGAVAPASVQGAEWIGWNSSESFVSPWVKDIAQEMEKKEYRAVFLNDPRAPQMDVIRLLNRAAVAFDANNPTLGQDFLRQAMEVLNSGIRKHYYSEQDIQPLLQYIQQHAPAKAAA